MQCCLGSYQSVEGEKVSPTAERVSDTLVSGCCVMETVYGSDVDDARSWLKLGSEKMPCQKVRSQKGDSGKTCVSSNQTARNAFEQGATCQP